MRNHVPDDADAKRKTPEKLAKKPPANVTLPPIDATPEEIAQVLFQRPPLKKPKTEDSDGG